MPDDSAVADEAIFINGDRYSIDDLTFAEQRAMRTLIQELAPPEGAGEIDIIPAFVCVVMRRSDPVYALEQALELKPSDLQEPAERPTKPRARKS